MVKAFLDIPTLETLLNKATNCNQSLLTKRRDASLSYKEKMLFTASCYAIPLLNNYMNDNLSSLSVYLYMRSIIETGTLLSLSAEDNFSKVNVPLFEDQYKIIYYDTYSYFTPDFVNVRAMKIDMQRAKEHINAALAKDGEYSSGTDLDAAIRKKMPMLLGRTLSDSVRYYLGYIYQNIYLRSGEMIHLVDYRGLQDKYALTFFNDVSRMCLGMFKEYDGAVKEDFSHPSKNVAAKNYKKVFLGETWALNALISKIDSALEQSFVSSGLKQLVTLENSLKCSLESGWYMDVNQYYKMVIELLTNINSMAGSVSFLTNFNYDDEISKLGKEERELKFVGMKHNLITPNLIWQNSSLRQVVYDYIDGSQMGRREYYSLNSHDFLKMKYYESQASSHGTGFLYYAPERYFSLDKEVLLCTDDLVRELLDKIRDTLMPAVDISVETEEVKKSLGAKDNLILSV